MEDESKILKGMREAVAYAQGANIPVRVSNVESIVNNTTEPLAKAENNTPLSKP